jgi:predicted nuclease with TOPRIM domain
MPEYDMPIEEQIKVLVKEFRTFKESVETRFDSIDTKLTTVDTKVTILDTKVANLDTKVTTLDTTVTTLNTKIDKVQVLLEDTHAIAKLGLEGLEGLRESTDAKFAAAAKTLGEQTGLLNSVLVHVRNRVDRIERPAAKGRRRP